MYPCVFPATVQTLAAYEPEVPLHGLLFSQVSGRLAPVSQCSSLCSHSCCEAPLSRTAPHAVSLFLNSHPKPSGGHLGISFLSHLLLSLDTVTGQGLGLTGPGPSRTEHLSHLTVLSECLPFAWQGISSGNGAQAVRSGKWNQSRKNV